MAGRPSIVSDYISVILRAIDKTQNDPAQLRGLVYDVARLSLGKHLLANYQQLGSAGLQRHLLDLETAIDQVEGLAQKQLEDFSKKSVDGPVKESTEALADSVAESNEQENDGRDRHIITVRDYFGDSIFENASSDQKSSSIVLRPASTEIYREVKAEVLEPLKVWEPAFGAGARRSRPDFWWGVQLLVAGLIGVAIYAVLLVRWDYFGAPRSSIAGQMQGAAASAIANAAVAPGGVRLSSAQPNFAPSSETLGFPPPRVYGVYAVNGGKLYELHPLPLKVPDPRVAISAIISNRSHVTIPDGKIEFVIFRRDLVAAAPTEVFVRVVARLTQEMKFSGNAPPTITKIEDQWAIRSKSYEFRVAPLGDNPEMVILHPADPQMSLPPGRYALVVAGRGYDFTVDGQITDTAQCLERTEVLGGAVYSECRALTTSAR
jgi:hypothetical protein